MTENVERQVIVEMLKDQLQGKQEEIVAQTIESTWVVAISEELHAPTVQAFTDNVALATYLKTLLGKPGFVYVFKGKRCRLSVGSLPVLYTPDEIIPLFEIAEPVFFDDGSLVATPPPQEPTPLPDDDAADEEGTEETALLEAPVPEGQPPVDPPTEPPEVAPAPA